ncbi:HTH-type transcriptional repressor RspR [Baekduia alba]|uniref:GntR family transcriptional regulator n=1 Tax=Baekduia alba TaxID=2997333 RepID=UPI00233FE048|nr:GntR family transcriptional regulator [Baekduia alba]WCB92217.1 HTH-type transcriptional repressor RspR [Baekduia alba]
MRPSLRVRAFGTSARDQAYVVLRAAIVGAELEPGRRLSENQLAELIGVSRTPVRDALARLRDERLVAIVPQLGTFVTYIDEDAVADAHFVREALEIGAVKIAAERIEADQLRELDDNLVAQERAVANDDAELFARLDDDLHHLLCDLSGREVAWRLSERTRGQLDRIRLLSLPEAGYREQMLTEHRAVVAAVGARDAPRAERELRHHLRMALSQLPAIREAHPEYFQED